MRVYFDRSGRLRGYSLGLFGVAGLWWLWLLLLPLTIPLYYFPRAVTRSGLSDAAKLLTIGGALGVLLIIGVLASAHTASQAKAAGCIPIAHVPSWYLLPASDSCAVGYTPRVGCTTTVSSDPAASTGGCAFGEKPRTVTGP